jgi:CubicO group peptidase (beta-lactamase class C family)
MTTALINNLKTILTYIFLCIVIHINGQNIVRQIDSIAQNHVSKGFNGNVLYSKDNTIVFTKNYGYTDIETKQTLNDSTIFELASISKQFTALAIVQLVEKKHFNYTTKVSHLIDRFPYDAITVEHLLRHQSGLPGIHQLLNNKTYWNRKKKATNNDVIEILKTHHLDLNFTPGSQYDYNNTGYVILASIIEKISGLSYKDYISKYIFKPANMLHSKVYHINDIPEDSPNTARGFTYNKRKKKYQRVEKDKNHKHIKWMNAIVGDRGIYASILDLEKWKQALRNNILISEESKRKMFSVDKVSSKYGFGFAIYKTQSKGKWVYHNGSWSGYKTSVIYLPESNEYLIILSNNRYNETYKSFEDELYALISNLQN